MMRAAAGLVVCVGLFGGPFGSAAAAAEEPPAFPPSLERESLLAWLRHETDIQPERVVAVTPQSLTAIVSTFPASGGQGPRAAIRAEALSPETFARTGSLSWRVSLTADCQTGRIKLGETTGYAARNLLGEARLLRGADTEWRVPEAGTALEYAWRAVCEPGFQGPFPSRNAAASQGTAPQASAAPSPAPAPAPPPASSRPAAPARAGGPVAQVGAGASEADARGLLAALGERAAGRWTWVETAKVGGRTWYRAVVGGFADEADAQAFCAALKAGGRPCFVRKPS